MKLIIENDGDRFEMEYAGNHIDRNIEAFVAAMLFMTFSHGAVVNGMSDYVEEYKDNDIIDSVRDFDLRSNKGGDYGEQ